MAKQSLAILPFRDLGGDQEHFGEGIADELLHVMSWAENLRCTALASSQRFQNMDIDTVVVGKRLRAHNLLIGDFRKAGNRFTLNAKLVKSTDGSELWSSSYDKTINDVWDIMDDILEHIVATLKLEVNVEGRLTVQKGSTKDPIAYDYFLQGLGYFRRYRKENIEKALGLFVQSVKADPTSSRAWARLAECHAKWFMFYESSSGEHADKADKASTKAVELSPEFARGWAARGLALMIKKEFIAAEDAFEKAVSINPRLFDAYYQHARNCFQMGNLKKAAKLFEKAAAVQPDDYQTPLILRQVYLSIGKVDEAIATAKRGIVLAQRHLELNPKDARATYLACGSMIQLGMYQPALEWAARALQIDPTDPMINYNVACCYAQAGETDQAMDCLEKAKGSGIVSKEWLKNDSDLVALRDLPRFKTLLEAL